MKADKKIFFAAAVMLLAMLSVVTLSMEGSDAAGPYIIEVDYNSHASIRVSGSQGTSIVSSAGYADEYYDGNSITLTPTIDPGYEFVRWEVFDYDLPGDWNETPPNGILTYDDLDANYRFTLVVQAATVTVQFDAAANGGTISGSVSKQVTYGSTYGSLPSASKVGYTFSGWYTNTIGGDLITSGSTVNITTTTTLYAQFAITSYVVEVDYNSHATIRVSGSQGSAIVGSYGYSEYYDYGQSITLSPSIDSGYEFVRWDIYDYDTPADWSETPPNGVLVFNDIDVHCRFILVVQPITVTVQFDAASNGGLLIGSSSMQVTYGSTYGSLPSASKVGYSFDGWYTTTTGGVLITALSTMSFTETTTLYAHFSISTYVMEVDYNSHAIIRVSGSQGTATVGSGGYADYYEYGQNITLTPTIDYGYEFVHWEIYDYDTPADWYETPQDGILVFNDIDVHCRFTLVVQAVTTTVKFDAAENGGILVGSEYKTVTYASQYGTLPTANKAGHTFNGWYTSPTGGTPITSSSNVLITTPTTLYAQFTVNTYIVEVNYNSHATIYVSGSTVSSSGYADEYTYGSTITLRVVPDSGYEFVKWTGVDRDWPDITWEAATATYTAVVYGNDTYTAVVGTPTPYVSDVFWDNGNYNGTVDMIFKFPGSTGNATHSMSMGLYTGTVQPDESTVWSYSGYSLGIELSYSPLSVHATLYYGGSAVSGYDKTVNCGSWSTFVLSLDPANGSISVTPIRTFDSFLDFTVYESQKKEILNFSAAINNAAIQTIGHSDGAGNPVRFSVYSTSVFLNTYGVVLYNPTINLYDYFPQYTSIRVNFFSFALYGDSITINGQTYPVTGASITIQYVNVGDDHCLPAAAPNNPVKTRTFELTNIYVTYNGLTGHCYLTFVNDRFTLDLGEYTAGNETISMAGIWYFSTMVYEPETGYEKHLTNWKILPETSKDQMLFIFLGILLAAGVFVAIHVKRSGLGYLDLVIIAAAGLVGFMLLG